MKKRNAIVRKLTALGLAAVLTFSMSGAVAATEVPSAEPAVQTLSEESDSGSSEEVVLPEEDSTDAGETDTDNNVPGEEIQTPETETGNEEGTGEITEPEESVVTDSEEEEELEAEEEETDEENAAVPADTSFKMEVTGVGVKLWKSQKNGGYYLFLPNNVSIPDVTFKVSGITFDSISRGSYDEETGVISKAFSGNNSSVTIKSKTGNSYKVTVMQSASTASVMINLNGVTLSQINGGSKDIKYPGNNVQIIDTAGGILDRGNVEIKGRGNTTWQLGSKKPYQIKFESKESVLGMAKAKKWVLLANAFDETMMRNEIAFEASRSLGMRYTPNYQYANVWVDGSYIGTYMIGEKVELGKGRVELSHPQGILCELDAAYYREEDYWFKTSVHTFAVKETVSESSGDIQAAMNNFKNKLEGLMSYLNNTSAGKVTLNGLSKYIDVDSFVCYYYMFDYLRLPDGAVSSIYFYMDGPDDVIHFGPVWDYDCSMGNNASPSLSSPSGYDYTRSPILTKLLPTAFNQRVNAYYQKITSGVLNPLATAQRLYSELQNDQKMNYTRWEYALGASGTANYRIKGDVAPFQSTYDAGYQKLANFLSQRRALYVPGIGAISVSQSGDSILVKYVGRQNYAGMQVAAWSAENGQDDLGWYPMSQVSAGNYQVKIPISKFKHIGQLNFHAYAGGTFLQGTSMTLKPLSDKPADITCVAAGSKGAEQTKFKITAVDYSTYSSTIKAAVWSQDKGQDDLVWYTMKPDGAGNFAVTFNVSAHKSLGAYSVHLYDGSKFLGNRTITVDPIVPGEVTAKDNEDGTFTVSVKVTSPSGISSVLFPIWTEKDGQDDLIWYTAEKQGDGTYSYTVSAEKHKMEGGKYIIHCYAKDGNGIQQFVKNTTITIEKPKVPELSITCTEVNGGQKVTVKNIPQEAVKVQVAFWGEKDGQNDLIWITKAYDSISKSASVTFSPNAKAETGLFYVHVYAVNSSGKQFYVGKTTFNRTNTVTGTISVTDIAGGKAKVTISDVKSSFKIASVQLPTWTHLNGQDDIVWHVATKVDDSTYTYTIAKDKHKNELGAYAVHAYARDEKGTQLFIAGTNFEMK